ncbi:MAG TPA: hypothetical protein ENJ50_11255, partial [Planctomycetaceae bacterium]|nr:hypothetical protein [Planctomycetaceae bacterium]
MTLWSVVLRSLQYHLRSHLVVAAGVAVATAVLTGALLVGDTVRHSLTALTQERLGQIDRVLLSEHFFRASRVERLHRAFPNAEEGIVPAVLVPQASISVSGKRRRTGRVTVIGSDAAFWRLRAEGTPVPRRLPDIDEIVLNRELADALAVSVGDRVTLRLPGTETIPSDSPFGEKEDLVASLPELEVIEILPDRGLARFEVFPSQRPPRNAFVSAESLREVLEQEDRWNALFLAQSVPSSDDDDVSLLEAMQWELADVGVEVRRVRLVDPTKGAGDGHAVYDYHALWSDRLFVPEAIDRAVERVFDGQAQPVLTYLANSIEKRDASSNQGRPVPYSLVTAVEVGRTFPLRDRDGREIEPIADNEII